MDDQAKSHARLEPAPEADNIEALGAVELEGLARGAVLELQRQHAHADEVGAVDALEALDDDRLDAEQHVPLAAQSREEPVPYSLPAKTTSGTPSFWYCIAAS